jgi:hypothetical protein
MVNMFHGERYVSYHHTRFTALTAIQCSRQVCSDFAFCQAVNYNSKDGDIPLPAFLSYDIGCEWWINFLKRVELCPGLTWDAKRLLIVAVGKWHLAAHVNDCFCKFSLNFILGAGHLDGEIMETIWSKLNAPGRTARAMSLAHRQQFLDNHLRDINFKKMISMGEWTWTWF